MPCQAEPVKGTHEEFGEKFDSLAGSGAACAKKDENRACTKNFPQKSLAYSLFANSVFSVIAKSLDVYALAKLLLEPSKRPFGVVAKELGMSASEFHAAVHRLGSSGLIDLSDRKIRVKPMLDFLCSGIRYVFPAQPGAIRQGMPTSYAAPPLDALLASNDKMGPVWPDAMGSKLGYAIEPLHPSAPQASRTDPNFYEILALIDVLREGRPRERQLAEKELRDRVRHR